MKFLTTFPLTVATLFFVFLGAIATAAEDKPRYAKEEYSLDKDRYAVFPLPLTNYEGKERSNGDWGIWEKLKYRAVQQGGFNLFFNCLEFFKNRLTFRRLFSTRALKFLNLLLGSSDPILCLTDLWELLAKTLDLSRDLEEFISSLIYFKFPFSGASRELILLPKNEIFIKLLKARVSITNVLEVAVGLLLLCDDDFEIFIWIELIGGHKGF